jgi:hypothetical protein
VKRSTKKITIALTLALGLIGAFAISLTQPIAQGIIAVVQNGLPNVPSLYGFGDSSSGLYFGTGRTGISKHLENAAVTTPVLSACGGTVAGDAGSSDTAGTATQGGTVTTCTVTFGTAYTAAPSCQVIDYTATRAGMAAAVTTTAITITGITASDKIGWFCVAKQGG